MEDEQIDVHLLLPDAKYVRLEHKNNLEFNYIKKEIIVGRYRIGVDSDTQVQTARTQGCVCTSLLQHHQTATQP